MVGWHDVYEVVGSMFPLYVAFLLGYGAVKWGRLFTPEQCEGINRFVALFILPVFYFDFAARMNPYTLNLRVLAAEAVSKLATLLILTLWGRFSSRGSYDWCITAISLCTMTNLLVIGVPVIQPMYGQWAVDLVVQLCVFQSLVWTPLILLLLEFRRLRRVELTRSPPPADDNGIVNEEGELDMDLASGVIDEEDGLEMDLANSPPLENNVVVKEERNIETDLTDSSHPSPPPLPPENNIVADEERSLIKAVLMKLATNPSVLANVFGFIWALLAHRFRFKMPSIMNGSIEILSKAGTGTVMFNLGVFTAMQGKLIACGIRAAGFVMVSKFVIGPAIMAVCSLAVGLHGPTLRFATVQAALPQAVASFVFAYEYGLHAKVLSTAVVLGTVISLPLLIGYFIALEAV